MTFSSLIPPIFLEINSTLSIYCRLSLKKNTGVSLVTLCDVNSSPLKFPSNFHVQDSHFL